MAGHPARLVASGERMDWWQERQELWCKDTVDGTVEKIGAGA